MLSPDGFLTLTDRAKDVIKSGGEWISLGRAGERPDGPPGGAGGVRGRRARRHVGRASAGHRRGRARAPRSPPAELREFLGERWPSGSCRSAGRSSRRCRRPSVGKFDKKRVRAQLRRRRPGRHDLRADQPRRPGPGTASLAGPGPAGLGCWPGWGLAGLDRLTGARQADLRAFLAGAFLAAVFFAAVAFLAPVALSLRGGSPAGRLLGGVGGLGRRSLGRRWPSWRSPSSPTWPTRSASVLSRRSCGLSPRAARARSTDAFSAAIRSTAAAGASSASSGCDHLAALHLGVDDLLQRRPVVVGELVRVEVAGHRVDQRAGHRQLRRPDRDVLVEEAEVGLADLVGPQHRVEHQHALAHPQRGELLALAQRHLDDRHPVASRSARRAAARTAWPPCPPAPGSTPCRRGSGRPARPARTPARRSRARWTAAGRRSRRR